MGTVWGRCEPNSWACRAVGQKTAKAKAKIMQRKSNLAVSTDPHFIKE
jgi:hypothetical protein